MEMKAVDNTSGILLEAGTNELEIVEFSIADALYGINIAKVREIIKADIDLVPLPDAHPSLSGAINLRGSIIPVVNLAKHLKVSVTEDKKINRIVIAEFNKIVIGFLVSTVARIHRISWREVEQPSQMIQTEQGYAVGIIKIQDKVIFLLDFEKISSHINPRAHLTAPRQDEYSAPSSVDRSSKKILVAEDSDFIRQMICDHLIKAGYNIETAVNGEEAWKKLMGVAAHPSFQSIENHYNCMVTDIEMPQVDGLHLIKRVKEDSRLRALPCIAFSSMITKELVDKCKSVGSDGEIAKPEINKLVALVDSKVL
ncbi:MAG: chemotaxis protein CheV [Candidatus Omnitrophica bacterium]|nr:chemotaxis protein CheV [Candidatus Omnitrophota bacterium]